MSGGFAGFARPPVVLDTARLPDDERATVEALAEAVLSQAHAGPPGPDRFQYDLRADGRAARFHEGALTPEAEALVSSLQG